jgi:hypothetical protein
MMESPRMEVTPTQGLVGRLLRAALALETSSKLAIVCCFFGWFLMSTLVVSLGSLEHGVRFYDLAAVIGDPTRLFFGVDSTFQRVAFGFLCLLGLLAPLAPHVVKNRAAWLAYLAPLVLMILCGVLLYSRNSGEFFATTNDGQLVSDSLMRLANNLVRRSTVVVSRHVSVGAGGYLAMIGSVVLGIQGVLRFRQTHASR